MKISIVFIILFIILLIILLRKNDYSSYINLDKFIQVAYLGIVVMILTLLFYLLYMITGFNILDIAIFIRF